MIFLDVVRVAVIVMVIVHHAAQAYGPTGGTWPISDPAQSEWFRPFYSVNAAVGLGLLFLLAGYFVPRSYDRKGSGRFLKERWARIGWPLIFFALLVHVPLVYLYQGRPPLTEFLRSSYADGWQTVYLHLWFLGHLLVYSAIYVGWRRLTDRPGRRPRMYAPPGHSAILGFVVALALVSWLVREWYPIDEWVPLFYVLAAEPAHLPQYASLFVLGAMAYRGDWFRKLPTRLGMIWLGIGLAAAAAVYGAEAVGLWGNVVEELPRYLWPLGATLEALICVGLSIGLIVAARELFHQPRRLITAMSSASYAAYILHIFVVVGLQAAILGLDLPAFAKFGLAALAGVVLSFGVGYLSSKTPGLRVVLGTAPSRREKNPQSQLRVPADF
ncbi:MAG TPA: acyltransferase family protein [Acidimicrobiia bacterium]